MGCRTLPTTAAAPQLRFDERNIHKAMRGVQPHKSGISFRIASELISRIGQEAVEEIESNHNRYRGLSKSAGPSRGVSTET